MATPFTRSQYNKLKAQGKIKDPKRWTYEKVVQWQNRTRASRAAAAAPPYEGYMNVAQIRAQAAKDAAAMVAAERAGYQSQIQPTLRQGATQAAAETNAAEALARLLSPVAGQVQNLYQNAGQSQASLAQGYSGQMGADLQSQAAADNAQLAALGLVPNVEDQSQNAANVLYGLGGSLPASNLYSQGAGFGAAASFLPATARTQGQQYAMASRAAAADAVAKLRAEMAAVGAKRPAYQQEALKSLFGIQSELSQTDVQRRAQALYEQQYDLKAQDQTFDQTLDAADFYTDNKGRTVPKGYRYNNKGELVRISTATSTGTAKANSARAKAFDQAKQDMLDAVDERLYSENLFTGEKTLKFDRSQAFQILWDLYGRSLMRFAGSKKKATRQEITRMINTILDTVYGPASRGGPPPAGPPRGPDGIPAGTSLQPRP